MMNHALVHVLCFGNLWHGDDGFGLHVLRRLRDERRLPSHVRAFDAGTAGLNAIPLFEGCNKAVLVDAVETGAKIGQLHHLSLTGYVPAVDQPGMHGSGVESLLAALPVAFRRQHHARARPDRSRDRPDRPVHRRVEPGGRSRHDPSRRAGNARVHQPRPISAADDTRGLIRSLRNTMHRQIRW